MIRRLLPPRDFADALRASPDGVLGDKEVTVVQAAARPLRGELAPSSSATWRAK